MAERNIDQPGAFAVFEGTIDRARAADIFSKQSLRDRIKNLSISLAAGLITFGICWLRAINEELPSNFLKLVSILAGGGVFGFLCLQQFGSWHARRWANWNSFLTGRYRITLFDEYVDVQASNAALRMHYSHFQAADDGTTCVRLLLDKQWATRALLLPIDDCRPAKTLEEVKSFAKEALARNKGLLAAATVPPESLPMPFELADGPQRIAFDGPLQQGHLLETLESTKPPKSQKRKFVLLFLFLSFAMMVGVYIGSTYLDEKAPAPVQVPARQDRRFHQWPRLIGGFVAVAFIIYAWIKVKLAKAEVRADPEAEAMYLSGWISPSGASTYYRRGYVALDWQGCDAIETADDRIVLRFWKGDFLVVGRHTFRTDADFQQAANWARAGAKLIAESADSRLN